MLLKLGIGIDKIKFGMICSEIENILGKPDRIRIDQDDEHRLFWDFNKPKIRLSFYQREDDKLGYIETSNPNILFNGHRIINSHVDFVKSVVFKDLSSKWELDEYHSFSVYFYEKYWLTLHVEYDKVTNLEIGVTFKDDDEYNWPDLTQVQ